MRGIYKIINPDGKIYIGLSKNIELRWTHYKNGSSMNGNSLLKESFKKFNHKNHKFEIIEEVIYNENLSDLENNKILIGRERYWIKYYISNINGLNQNKGGSGPGKHNIISKKQISNALKGKPKPKNFGGNRKKWQHTEEFKDKIKIAPRCPVLMFDLEDNFIQEFPNQQLAANFLGVKKQAIWNMMNGFVNRNGKPIIQVRGFKFKYKL